MAVAWRQIEGIKERIKGKAGLKYETIKGMAGVQKVDAFGKDHALILVRTDDKLNLDTLALP